MHRRVPSPIRLRRLLRCAVALIVLVTAGGVHPAPAGRVAAQTPDPSQALTGLTQQIEALRQSLGLPGLAVSVVYDGRLLYSGGFGYADVAAGTPVTADTLFSIASNTKLFTATMTMQLRDAGLFSLDDSVGGYVPDVYYQYAAGPSGPPATVSPTFRQLASYSSGLPDYATGPQVTDVATLYQQLHAVVTTTAPGSAFIYSNLGFAALGYADTALAAQQDASVVSYEQYVTDHILAPLGMNSSSFDVDAARPALATPYLSSGPSWRSGTAQGRGAYDPGGGIFSSANDMAKFMNLQFGTGSAGGAQVLACSSVQEMWEPQIAVPNGSADLGWFSYQFRGQTLLQKDGGLPGYSSLTSVLPGSRLGVFLATNLSDSATGAGGLGKLNATILNALLPLLPASQAPVCSA